MSRFLRFLLSWYAPMAARHMLVEGRCLRPTVRHSVTKPGSRHAEFSACIDIGGRLRQPSATSDGLTSLAV